MIARLRPLLDRLPDHLGHHVQLVGASLAMAVAIALPLAVLAHRRPAWRGPLLGVAGVTQTVPGLALLALMVPVLAFLDDLTPFEVPSLGTVPTLIALTVYAILPILRNAITGLAGVDPALVEAGEGLGLTPTDLLREVELPLAAPVIFAGVRTAATWTVGVATLATPVGQSCLGNYIFAGLQTRDHVAVLFGCVAAAALALTLDALLAGLERAQRPRTRVLVGAGLVALLAAGAAAPVLAEGGRSGGDAVVIGSKSFTEQYILGHLVDQRVAAAGLAVDRREGLGSTVIFDGLVSGEIDVSIDYSGTLWTNVLGREDAPGRQAVLDALDEALPRDHGVRLFGPLGFENAYGVAVRRTDAARFGWETIADLATHDGLVLGTDLEFTDRPEWVSLRDAYGLTDATTRAFDPTFLYEACAKGEVTAITAYTSDGRIKAFDLVVLDDPAEALPPYDALLMLGRDADRHGEVLLEALRPLLGALDVDRMREANRRVDTEHRPLGEVARWLGEVAAP